MFDWVKNRFLDRFEILSSFLFSVYKLIRENTQLEIMCDIAFENAKGCGGTVNTTSVYTEAAVRRVI